MRDLLSQKKTRIIISRDVLRCVKYGIPSHPHPGNPFGKTSAFVKKKRAARLHPGPTRGVRGSAIEGIMMYLP